MPPAVTLCILCARELTFENYYHKRATEGGRDGNAVRGSSGAVGSGDVCGIGHVLTQTWLQYKTLRSGIPYWFSPSLRV